jgi:L-ascorbate metabolism protein UlaG (beta-lactamase superfamily)
MTVAHWEALVDWLGHASIRVETPDGTVVYLDPCRDAVDAGHDDPAAGHQTEASDDSPAGSADGDLVCVSHVHHYEPAAIERVASPDATVVVYDAVHHSETDRAVTPVSDLPFDVVRVDAETDTVLAGVVFRTVAAYNEADGPHTDADGRPVHPEGTGCGFLLGVDDATVFWPGHTDLLAGHAELDASLLVVPIGGDGTLDRDEAATMAERLDPDLVVPVDYDTAGGDAAVDEFAADVARRGVPVVLEE